MRYTGSNLLVEKRLRPRSLWKYTWWCCRCTKKGTLKLSRLTEMQIEVWQQVAVPISMPVHPNQNQQVDSGNQGAPDKVTAIGVDETGEQTFLQDSDGLESYTDSESDLSDRAQDFIE